MPGLRTSYIMVGWTGCRYNCISPCFLSSYVLNSGNACWCLGYACIHSVCMWTCIYILSTYQVCMYTCINTDSRTHAHINVIIYIHTCMHACRDTHTHTNTYVHHTHLHTHTCIVMAREADNWHTIADHFQKVVVIHSYFNLHTSIYSWSISPSTCVGGWCVDMWMGIWCNICILHMHTQASMCRDE